MSTVYVPRPYMHHVCNLLLSVYDLLTIYTSARSALNTHAIHAMVWRRAVLLHMHMQHPTKAPRVVHLTYR
jgi:hypothetical protein